MLTLLGCLFASGDCVFVVALTERVLCNFRSKLVGNHLGNIPISGLCIRGKDQDYARNGILYT